MSQARSPRAPEERREALKLLYLRARDCTRCTQLASTRKTVVFGAGNADAQLMFVGEAPGASEDEQGVPFVGRAGKLLDQLLGEISLARKDVFITNVLRCRPPGNRDPLPLEIENCEEYLMGQIELIEPSVICTLGNFSTKLLRGDPTGITRLHGRSERRVLGGRAVWLYPIYHPAAALYTPRMLETLREDVARLPELLAMGPPPQPDPSAGDASAAADVSPGADVAGAEDGAGGDSEGRAAGAASPPAGPRAAEADQLGLF